MSEDTEDSNDDTPAEAKADEAAPEVLTPVEDEPLTPAVDLEATIGEAHHERPIFRFPTCGPNLKRAMDEYGPESELQIKVEGTSAYWRVVSRVTGKGTEWENNSVLCPPLCL